MPPKASRQRKNPVAVPPGPHGDGASCSGPDQSPMKRRRRACAGPGRGSSMAALRRGTAGAYASRADGRRKDQLSRSAVVRAAGTGLLAAVVLLVDGRPGDPFGVLAGLAFLLLAALDVAGLALLLVAVAGFVTAWHGSLSWPGGEGPV